MRLDAALRSARSVGRPSVVPYVLVDRARRSAFRATIAALADAGASAVELGFPFSDPIADGPVLAAAADRALADGTRWTDLIESSRVASELLPVAVMTYANPVLRHGLADGLLALRDAGTTGLIVPDLSLEESGPWRAAARRAGVSLVLLAAPAASPDRVARIARSTSGFLYLVSRYGTTGRAGPSGAIELGPLVRSARRAAPRVPVLIGFGVRDPASARRALASGADGVVIGSALEERRAAGATPASIGRWLSSIVRSLPPRAPS